MTGSSCTKWCISHYTKWVDGTIGWRKAWPPMSKALLGRSLEIGKSPMSGRSTGIQCPWGCREKGKAAWTKQQLGDVPIGVGRCIACKQRSRYVNKRAIDWDCKRRYGRFWRRPAAIGLLVRALEVIRLAARAPAHSYS